GTHIGLSVLWLAAASILYPFDITKAEDENGNLIKPPVDYGSGTVLHPSPFTCNISPRSKEAESLICAAVDYT
ncbi:hypothetical protein BDQ12DRAFT_619747, partial [Crucibulum laeve]